MVSGWSILEIMGSGQGKPVRREESQMSNGHVKQNGFKKSHRVTHASGKKFIKYTRTCTCKILRNEILEN